MSEWKEYRLGDICQTNKSQYSAKENWENFLYLDTGNITKGIVDDIQEFDSFVNLPSRARRKVEDGDIIYSSVRPNQEHYGYISNPPINLLVSTGFVVISANKDIINPLFLYNYLTRTKITKYLQAIGEQSVCTYPAIKPSDIEDLIVKIPSIKIQKRIASILSSLDDKIAVNKKICENLEAQAQALFKHWFIDFAPFKDGKFIDSELGLIPEGWRVGTLGDYCVIRSGFAFKSSWWQDEGVKVVKIKNITDGGTLDMSDCSCVSEEHASLASSFQTKSGDLLIAMTGATIGKFCVVHGYETYCVNQRVGKFFLGDNPLDKLPFIYCILKRDAVYKEIVNKGQGSAQPNISGKDIEEIKIIFPPKSIIEQFNEELHSSFKFRINSELESRRLATLRDTLLPKLMSGQIEV